MKRMFLLLWLAALTASADDVYCKDGKILRGLSLRREGAWVFGKPLGTQDPQVQETLIALNQLERIAFTEPVVLREARQAAYLGNATLVLSKTEAFSLEHRQWMDIAGNLWRELMRMRIPALVSLDRKEELTQVLNAWTPTGDNELEEAVKLLTLKMAGGDKAPLLEASKRLTADNAGTLGAALGWLELGGAALDAKRWPEAIRAFVSIQVFAPAWRLLYPEALLGAVRAAIGSGKPEQANPFVQDLQSEYATSPQAAKALQQLPP